MSEYRILDGTVTPIRGHWESDGITFTLEDPDIDIDTWRKAYAKVPISELDGISTELTDLPYKSTPDNWRFYHMGDRLQMGYQWFSRYPSPSSNTDLSVFLALSNSEDDSIIKNVERCARNSNYTHGYNVTIAGVSLDSSGEYYNANNSNYTMISSFFIYLFVYDTAAEKVYQVPYWTGAADSNHTDLQSSMYWCAIGPLFDYLYSGFMTSVAINNGAVKTSNSNIKIDVTPYVDYV